MSSEEYKLKQIHETNKQRRDALNLRGYQVGCKIRGIFPRYIVGFILEFPEHKGQKDLVRRVARGQSANEIIVNKLESFYDKLRNL